MSSFHENPFNGYRNMNPYDINYRDLRDRELFGLVVAEAGALPYAHALEVAAGNFDEALAEIAIELGGGAVMSTLALSRGQRLGALSEAAQGFMHATGTKFEYYITVLAKARKFSKISELASLQLSERVYNGGATGPLDGVHRNYDGFPGSDVSGQAFNFWGRPIYKTIKEVLTEEKCFSSSTKICLLDDSNVRIKDIRVGDIVLSFDPSADNGRGGLVPRRVTRTFTNITEEWLRLRWVENGEEKELVTTPGHHFLDRFGKFPQIERMIADGVGTVILADGSEATVTADRIVYSAETADMFEQAEGWVMQVIDLAFVAPASSR